jgi:hypothetical protein
VALIPYRVIRAELASMDRVLLAAGEGSIVAATVGMFVGRSPTLCGVFVVVGAVLIGASPFAPRSPERYDAVVRARREVAEVADVVVVNTDDVTRVRSQHGERPGGYTKLTSAIYLVFLLVFTTALLSVIAVAIVIGFIVLLSGH